MLRQFCTKRRKFGRIYPRLCFHSLLRSATTAILVIQAGKAMHFPAGWSLPSKSNVRDTMLRYFLSIALVSLAMLAGARAEEQRSGTADEQKACTRDVQKLCRNVIDQGDFTILACLKENRPKISPACDAVLKSHNQ